MIDTRENLELSESEIEQIGGKLTLDIDIDICG
jgi:hypothetical protein